MNAVMAISTAQATAIAKAEQVSLPRKDNGWVRFGNVTLKRLPKMFRKRKAHAQAYRLTAPNHEDLERFYAVANEHGHSVCIVYQNED